MNLCILIKLLNQPSLINYYHRAYIVSSCRQHESKYIYINRTRDDVITWTFSAFTRWISLTKGPVMGSFDIPFLIGLIRLLNSRVVGDLGRNNCHVTSLFYIFMHDWYSRWSPRNQSHDALFAKLGLLPVFFLLFSAIVIGHDTRTNLGHCGDVSFHPLDTRFFFYFFG